MLCLISVLLGSNLVFRWDKFNRTGLEKCLDVARNDEEQTLQDLKCKMRGLRIFAAR